MDRAAIYLRISDDREGRELGVDRQEQDCRALAARRGFTVVDLYKDNDIGASTRSRKLRPEYRQMLRDARDLKFDVILAYTSGRLTRRPREHEDCIDLSVECGIRFEYVRSPSFDLNTAQGRRVARTLAAQDAGESEDISERVQRAHLQAATEGRFRGGTRPYGYEADGVTVRSDEAESLRWMSEQILMGQSLHGLARELNGRGLVTSTGSRWTQTNIRQLLLRPRNAGLSQHQGRVISEGVWRPVVPIELWHGVVAKLTDPGRRTAFSTARLWLGSGLFLCGVCGDGTTVTTTRAGRPSPLGESSRRSSVSVCSSGGHLVRRCDYTDAWVSELVVARLSDPKFALRLDDSFPDEMGAVRAEIAAARHRLDELTSLFTDGAIDVRQMSQGSATLRARLSAMEARLSGSGKSRVVGSFVAAAESSEDRVDAVRRAWESCGLDRRRAVVDTVVSVRLMPAKKGRPAGWRRGEPYFRADSIVVLPKGD